MTFVEDIKKDINWRLGELGTLKSLIKRYELQPPHKQMLIRYMIPAIYAIWEGYVKHSFTVYAHCLNSKQLTCKEVHNNILTYAIEINDKLRLHDSRTNIETQRAFINTYNEYYEAPLWLGDKVLTNDNVDFAVICSLLDSFNLMKLPEPQYKKQLNRLLFLRNEVAHGGKSVPIKIEDIEDNSQLVVDLMSDVLTNMEQGYKHQTYLKDNYRDIVP